MGTKNIYKGVYYHVALAQSPSLSPDLAEKLSTHKNVKVRKALAENPMTPGQILAKLEKDPCDDVRRNVGLNSNLPLNQFLKMFNDHVNIRDFARHLMYLSRREDSYWEEKIRLNEVSYRDVRAACRLWTDHFQKFRREHPFRRSWHSFEEEHAPFLKEFLVRLARISLAQTDRSFEPSGDRLYRYEH